MEHFSQIAGLLASIASIITFFILIKDRFTDHKAERIANQAENNPTRRSNQLRRLIGLFAVLSSLFMLAFLQFSGRAIPLTTEDAATIAGSIQLFALGVLLLRG